jgi:cytochrome P450
MRPAPRLAPPLPPGPTESALTQTIQWARDPLHYLDRARERFGPMWTSRLVGFPPLVHLSEPSAIQEVFTGDNDILHAGQSNRVLEPVVGSDSILLLDGPRHLKHRRALLPLFQGERAASHAAVFHAVTLRSIAGWPRGVPFRLFEAMQALTLDVILAGVFGVSHAEEDGSFRDDLRQLVHGAIHPILMLRWAQVDLGRLTPWRRLMRLRASIDRRIYALIDARRASPNGATDMLSILASAREEDGTLMTPKTLRDELVTLLLAGHDTVASGLTWTFHHLFENPLVLERARAEVDDALQGRSFDPSQKLPWIDAVAREALRLVPVLPIVGRRLQADYAIGGVLLPRGARAAPNIYLAHREHRSWRDPTRFSPERFLSAAPSPYAYLPFGGGIRRCIGMAFALVEMRVVVALLLRHLSIARAPGAPTRAVRRGVMITPSGGLPVILRDRSR